MTAKELRKKYIQFFVKRGHREIFSASLVPENDPTALFTSAGMHPLVPYLLGEPHPLGRRLVSCQKCLRTADIDRVGDTTHHTFFEMLGNWSLGDYFKKEQISWSYEFLTKELNLDPKRLSVSVFAGDEDAPRDEESFKIWLSLGIPKERIYFFPKENNWWGPVGKTGPCGPDTEMFYDTGKPPCGRNCRPEDGCGRYFEIWNDVFMEYNKTKEGKYEPLAQKNVDTGMGVERTATILQGKDDDYETELFAPIIRAIEEVAGKNYVKEEVKRGMRIIADHLRAATFAIADGVSPSNKDRGYVIRRLIRRALHSGYEIGIRGYFSSKVADAVIKNYLDIYPEIAKEAKRIKETLLIEEEKFQRVYSPKTLRKVENLIKRDILKGKTHVETLRLLGKTAFSSFATFGVFPDFSFSVAKRMGVIKGERDQRVAEEFFEKVKRSHQEKSRVSLAQKFAGGLSDHSERVTKLHTATHLLHQALREVLGAHVSQAGSNITPKRLRFDFTHHKKLTAGEIKKVEKFVNQKIRQNLPVTWKIVSLEQAKKEGALSFFEKKYGEKVKVYSIGDFSKEVCGGPHVDFTGILGRFKILKEESAGAGVRRVYGVLE